MPIGASGTKEHILELDSVRGLAAVAVLFCHLPRGLWFGETGVDLFFVLSGFLISGIILNGMDQPHFLRTFYIRRSLRILPIYYLSILIAFAINYFRRHPDPTDGLGYYLLYLQNVEAYWGVTPPNMTISLGPTWTLAIEEQFYLLWPASLYALKNTLTRSAILWLSLALLMLTIVLRAQGLSRLLLLAHADGLALGAILAYVYRRLPDNDFRNLRSVFLATVVTAFSIYWLMWVVLSAKGNYTGRDHIHNSVAITLMTLGYFGVVGYVVARSGEEGLKWLRHESLTTIGKISYGLYLYHWIYYEFLDTFVVFRWELGHPYWLDAVKLSGSLVIALVSWRYIEKPILKLKDKFHY